MKAELLNQAREFINSPLSLRWTKTEQLVIDRFFTNARGRIFFIHTLPSNMSAVLMAMYSRLRNSRGLRGMMVDSFLPQVLSTFVPECQRKFQGDQAKFVQANGIKSLDQFISYSADTAAAYEEFMHQVYVNPKYLQKMSNARKMQVFLRTWLETYGHNSIARPAMVYLCAEQVSILLAKALEWCRPGVGYIELSTRYVDMHGKDIYPIAVELSLYGVPENEVENVLQASFDAYRYLQGENFDGPFPSFLREQYRSLMTESQLQAGVVGETCDVLGNLLPAATLTSLGIGISGESLPVLIKHLLLDGNPEYLAASEAIQREAAKIGADQFLRHLEVSEWEQENWGYLLPGDDASQVLPQNIVDEILLQTFRRKSGFNQFCSWEEVINRLTELQRTSYDKLSREFEVVSASFFGQMSFRGWRDLHRMGMSTHRRGYLNPHNGFYQYDKPAPTELGKIFHDIHDLNLKLYDLMVAQNVPEGLREYPLALGNLIPFLMGSNLRQWEFCHWQRTKPTVNHEVRQTFLAFEQALRRAYPWWSKISRANTAPAYIFARGGSDLLLP